MDSKNTDQFDLESGPAGNTQLVQLPHQGIKVDKSSKKEKLIKGIVNKMNYKLNFKVKNEYDCQECDLKTKSASYLKRHVESKHIGVRFPCRFCKHRALYKHDLDNHVKAKHRKSAKFKCEKCDYSTHIQRNLTKHNDFRHEGKTYPCNECDFQAASKSSLGQHVKSIHENVKYNCEFCEFSGTQQGDVIKHKKRVHLRIEFKCSDCDYVGKEKMNLKRHIAAKHEVAHKFQCKACNYKTNMKRNLKKHFEALHKHKHKKYICNKCHQSFSLPEYLGRHMKSVHTDKLLKCEDCNYKTKTKSILKMHIEAIHDKIVYRCDLCDYSSGWRSHLSKHKVLHTSNEEIECKLCDYKTRNKISLKSHHQSKHGNDNFSCDNCIKTYTNQAALRRHVKIHHSLKAEMKLGWLGKKLNIPKEIENVQCDVCCKMFTGMGKLKVHKRKLHQGSVNCDICVNATFKSRTAFLQHKRSVHEKIRFKCNECKHEATQKGDLKRHQIRMHKIKLKIDKEEQMNK